MSVKLTREELHELVWSKPGTALAKEIGVSDVAISKACRRYFIPRPPMGHWAKVKAGKKVHRLPLLARGPGMSNEIEIGGRRYHYSYDRRSDEELAASEPRPPVFEDELSDVKSRVKKSIKKFSVSRELEKVHRLLRRFLDDDEERRKKVETSRYVSSWDMPIFDDPLERRRLKILNALFTAAEQNGMKPTISGKEVRTLGIKVNDQHVSFTLDAKSQRPNQWGEISIRTKGTSSKMRLALESHHSSSEPTKVWEDHGRSLVEHKLHEILIEIIITGEVEYRDWMQRNYEWAVDAKATAIEDLRKKKEEEERLERERIAKAEQDRIDHLLAGASALKQATEIRNYVDQVIDRCVSEPDLADTDVVEAWSKWALAQADRIDPVIDGQFLEFIQNQT